MEFEPDWLGKTLIDGRGAKQLQFRMGTEVLYRLGSRRLGELSHKYRAGVTVFAFTASEGNHCT